MGLFHVIDDAHVILRARGVYRQAKVFRRGQDIFAGYGAGFIKLLANGGTSHPTISWEDIDVETVAGPLGRPRLAAIK